MNKSKASKLPDGWTVPYHSVEETATLTGLSQAFLYKGVKEGRFPCERAGRCILIDVPALIDELRAERKRQRKREALRPTLPFQQSTAAVLAAEEASKKEPEKVFYVLYDRRGVYWVCCGVQRQIFVDSMDYVPMYSAQAGVGTMILDEAKEAANGAYQAV